MCGFSENSFDDFCVLTSFYNPSGYKTKLVNYLIFRNHLYEAGVPLFTVELAFGGHSFEIDPDDSVTQIRGGDIMWQKERLLNELIKRVPKCYTKIAWIDCDIIFENGNWASDTSRLLERNDVVQLFETAIRLPKDTFSYNGLGEKYVSFASNVQNDRSCLNKQKWDYHGHTGFAWAVRREVIEPIGLYDACITGSADHLMAHAFCGDWDSNCLISILGVDTPYQRHYLSWCKQLNNSFSLSIGCTSGRILHLWHGETKNRNYHERNRELASMDFDPDRDIIMDSCGVWKWSRSNLLLEDWASSFFGWRKEDGDV